MERNQKIASCIKRILLNLRDWFQPAIDDYGLISHEAQEATRTIEQLRRKSNGHKTVHEYASKVLAAAPGLLSIAKISRLMQEDGYQPKGAHRETYLSRVLRAHPGIFEVDDYMRLYVKRHHLA